LDQGCEEGAEVEVPKGKKRFGRIYLDDTGLDGTHLDGIRLMAQAVMA
jgi:hypothetical protein